MNTGGITFPMVDQILDGVAVTFTNDPASRGTITPSASTVRGIAIATFTPGTTDGTATIAVAIDAQRIERRIIVDREGPSTLITGPKDGATLKRLGRTAGTAADPTPSSGIGLVEVALRRKIGDKCAIWNGSRWIERGCNARRWLKANGRNNWALRLPDSLPGSYSIFSRATDRAGNRSAAKFVKGKTFITITIVATPMGVPGKR